MWVQYFNLKFLVLFGFRRNGFKNYSTYESFQIGSLLTQYPFQEIDGLGVEISYIYVRTY